MTCSICGKKGEDFIKTTYGDICSIECFDVLCDDVLGDKSINLAMWTATYLIHKKLGTW